MSKHARWEAGIDAVRRTREGYSLDRHEYYAQMERDCMAILRPIGDVLDLGCGDGSMGDRIAGRGDVRSYVGVDVIQHDSGTLPFSGHHPVIVLRRGRAEQLPALGGVLFDTALFYSSLQHIERPAQALIAAWRALKSNGILAIQVPVNDRNPIFVSWWRAAWEVAEMVRNAGFNVETHDTIYQRLLCLRAVKNA